MDIALWVEGVEDTTNHTDGGKARHCTKEHVMFTNTIKKSLKGSTLAVLAGTTLIAVTAPIGLGQVKNCAGGTIDLSTFPAGEKNMRDFHLQRLGSGSAIESVKVWKINADGTETEINWTNSNNHGGSKRVSYGSDQDEANDQKIKWRVCFVGSKAKRVQVHITQDGNVNFNGWGRDVDVNKALCAATLPGGDTGNALVMTNETDFPELVRNVQVFVSPDPTIIDLPIDMAIDLAQPLPPDAILPEFHNPEGVMILPGDVLQLTNLPLPPEPGFTFIVTYDGFNEGSQVEQQSWQMFQNEQGPCEGDVNGDGVVDLQDLNIVLSRFGFGC